MLLDCPYKEIQILYEAGYRTVVMEAAVVLQGGWDQHVYEFWACIFPYEEVESTSESHRPKECPNVCTEVTV